MRKILIFLLAVSLISCLNEKESTLPVLSTSGVTEISQTTAKSGGNISDDGGSDITLRGVCWSTSPNPTIESNKTTDGLGTGSFTSSISGMTANTRYYARAYATNKAGTGYGNQVEFTTIQVEAWMTSPYFALPDKGVALMAGQEVTIYGDALINIPVNANLEVTYTCDIGKRTGNNFMISPAGKDIGNHSLTITFKSNGITLTSASILLAVYPKASGGSRKILLIGDSTMPPDIQQQEIVSVLDNTTLSFLGTIGSSYKNEGYGGASWNGFITGDYGKFNKNGNLNIPAYFSDYSVQSPDYVFIRLGINDTFPFSVTGTGPMEDSDIDAILQNVKTLTDAFLAYNPRLKVILGLPTISENTGAGWAHNYDEQTENQNLFIEQMHRYWKRLIETYANGVYNPRVDCSYEAIFLDRDNGYPKVNGIHSNGVHPDDSGYEQLATGMAITFNKLMNTE